MGGTIGKPTILGPDTLIALEIQCDPTANGYGLGSSGADGNDDPTTIVAVTAITDAARLMPDGIAGPLAVRAGSIGRAATASRRCESAGRVLEPIRLAHLREPPHPDARYGS